MDVTILLHLRETGQHPPSPELSTDHQKNGLKSHLYKPAPLSYIKPSLQKKRYRNSSELSREPVGCLAPQGAEEVWESFGPSNVNVVLIFLENRSLRNITCYEGCHQYFIETQRIFSYQPKLLQRDLLTSHSRRSWQFFRSDR